MKQRRFLTMLMILSIMITLGFAMNKNVFGDLVVLSAYAEGDVSTNEETGEVTYSGWIDKDDGRYYYNDNMKVTGMQVIEDETYYFNDEGQMQTGFMTIDDHTYYFVEKINDEDPYGQMMTGKHKVNGATYYFDAQGVMQTGFVTIKNDQYYFNTSGKMVTGWIQQDNYFYHFAKTGERDKKEKKIYTINNKRYYLSAKGKAYTGWQKISGKYYYFDKKTYAAKVNGVKKIGNYYYGFSSKGVNYRNGWKKISGKKYYFKSSNGRAVTGTKKIGKKLYTFSSKGVLKTSYTNAEKMDRKAYNLKSKTKYLILVNCKTHRVGVYEGKKGSWKRLFYWQCGDGKPSSPTIKGTFETGRHNLYFYKTKYFDAYGDRQWYATRISGHYLFHSVTYVPAKTPATIRDGRVGAGVSHGCVRLELNNAKWIYDNVPQKTKVVIYK